MSLPHKGRATAMLSLASALALSACAGLPDSSPLANPKSLSALAVDASLAGAPKAAWPSTDWWRAYGDAQLDTLMAEALAGAPDLATAAARLDRARAQQAQSGSVLAPSLTAQAGVSETKQSYYAGIPPAFVPHGYNDQGQGSLSLSYEIDFWGKNAKSFAAATSTAEAAAADLALARVVLTTGVASAYADLARGFADRDVAEQSLRVKTETLALVARRVANGLDTQSEVKQAEAGLALARADLTSVEEDIATTRHRLAALIGAGPDRGLAINRPAGQWAPRGIPADLPLALMGRRPDIVAARLRVEAAAARIGVAEARFYPNVNLSAAIGVQALLLSNLTTAGADTGQIGPAITLPIFDNGSLRANLASARADYDEAVATYDATLAEALRQIADAVTSQRSAAARLADTRAATAASDEAYRLARLRYEGGLSTYQTVLIAETATLSNRRALADLEARAVSLDIALTKALGGGWPGA